MSSEIFHTVAQVGDVPEGQGLSVEVDGLMIALFHDGGQYYAMDDNCPHQGMPLSDGIVSDRTVECSWHGWRFSLESGKWLDSPRTCVKTYPVRVEGSDIKIGVRNDSQ